GPKWHRKLNEHGYHWFSQIMAMTDEDVHELDKLFEAKGKIVANNWREEATNWHLRMHPPAITEQEAFLRGAIGDVEKSAMDGQKKVVQHVLTSIGELRDKVRNGIRRPNGVG